MPRPKKANPIPNHRPEKPIDWDKVDQLLLAGCLGTEIAPHFNMHPTTFYDRVQIKYGMTFTLYSCQKHQEGDSLLRAAQYKNAMKGNTTMQIWLGKNRLKQKEGDDKGAPPNDKPLTEIIDQLNGSKSKTDPELPGSEQAL